MDDRMEQLIAAALTDAGVEFRTDYGGGNPSGLDFLLPQEGVEIEVKRFHSPRIAEQMARAENVIVAQGEGAVRFLAALIHRSGYTPAQAMSAGTAKTEGLGGIVAGIVQAIF